MRVRATEPNSAPTQRPELEYRTRPELSVGQIIKQGTGTPTPERNVGQITPLHKYYSWKSSEPYLSKTLVEQVAVLDSHTHLHL